MPSVVGSCIQDACSGQKAAGKYRHSNDAAAKQIFEDEEPQ